jgi:hypothetical protein
MAHVSAFRSPRRRFFKVVVFGRRLPSASGASSSCDGAASSSGVESSCRKRSASCGPQVYWLQ